MGLYLIHDHASVYRLWDFFVFCFNQLCIMLKLEKYILFDWFDNKSGLK